MATLYITDSMLTDGIVNGYNADSISLDRITIPIQLGYTPGNEDAYIAPADAEDPQLTGDTFTAFHKLVLSHGDDTFGLVEGGIAPEVYGGDGNDTLSSSIFGFGTVLDGGSGNDRLYGEATERDHLLGREGNDTLFVSAGDEATGGTGSDRFVITDMQGASDFICDLKRGDHDVVDLWAPLHVAGYEYASFTQAQAAGTLGVSYLHGYTYLSFDTDGDHVPDHEFAHIKGVVTPDQLDQTFPVSYENSYYHLAGDV
ncbi:MAG TPA: hypothetical protein VGM26_13515 [Rhizomicrobium sp.]